MLYVVNHDIANANEYQGFIRVIAVFL